MTLGPDVDIPKGSFGSEAGSEGRASITHHEWAEPTVTMAVHDWHGLESAPSRHQSRRRCNIL